MEENIERTVSEVLREFREIRLAILFGSAGRGCLRPESDIDLAVAGDAPLDPESKFRLIGELGSASGRPVDLIDLSVTSGPVLMEILRGRAIKHEPHLFARLMRKAWNWEADIAPTWRETVKERNARIFG